MLRYWPLKTGTLQRESRTVKHKKNEERWTLWTLKTIKQGDKREIWIVCSCIDLQLEVLEVRVQSNQDWKLDESQETVSYLLLRSRTAWSSCATVDSWGISMCGALYNHTKLLLKDLSWKNCLVRMIIHWRKKKWEHPEIIVWSGIRSR